MKSLVIGASGLVGGELYKQLLRGNYPVTGTYAYLPIDGMKKLDIRDKYAVMQMINREAPDVIYLAAYESWVDWCETHPEESAETNVDGCYNVIDAANKVGATVIFFSSSYVFSGRDAVNAVTTIRNPLNTYGKQKVLVEDYITSNCDKYFIVRTVGVFGDEEKNFFGQVRDKLAKGEDVYASADQYMNPIYVSDLAYKTLQLVKTGNYSFGIYHIAGDTVVSKRSFAKRIAGELGYPFSHIKSSTQTSGARRPVRGDLYCDPLTVYPPSFSMGLRRLING